MKVTPTELEELLLSNPEITDAAVISYLDEEAVQVPMSFVVRKPGSNLCEEDVNFFVSKQDHKIKNLKFIFQKELQNSDVGSLEEWCFPRYWPNNKSRMYVLENTGEFVKTHGLRLGDFIMFYKDERNEKYIVKAKKVMNELITSGSSVGQTMITSSNSVDQSGPYSSPTFLEERSNQ